MERAGLYLLSCLLRMHPRPGFVPASLLCQPYHRQVLRREEEGRTSVLSSFHVPSAPRRLRLMTTRTRRSGSSPAKQCSNLAVISDSDSCRGPML